MLGNNRDVELVAEAFMNDPLVRGRATKEQIQDLARDMMSATLG